MSYETIHRPGQPLPGAAGENLLLDVAAGLHANGQETDETVRIVQRLASLLGLPATVAPSWSEVALRQSATDVVPRSPARPAMPAGVGMNRVAAVMRCVDQLHARRLSAQNARAEVARAVAMRPSSNLSFVIACALGASALALIFGARHPAAVALIAASAGAAGMLRRLLAGQGAGPVLQAFVAALLAGVLGAVAVGLGISSSLRLVAVCPCMILVPGPHILNGALDLAALRIPLGVARLTFAGLVLLAICTGLLAGLAIGGTTLPPSEPGREVALWIDALAAGTAAGCYGVFFSMPYRLLAWPVAAGMTAHAARWYAMSAFGVSAATGAGLAAVLVGLALVPVARRFHMPFAAIGFASVVSLMPGVFIFRLASAFVDLPQITAAGSASVLLPLLGGLFSDAAATLLITLAITLGLAVPRHAYRHFSRPAEA